MGGKVIWQLWRVVGSSISFDPISKWFHHRKPSAEFVRPWREMFVEQLRSTLDLREQQIWSETVQLHPDPTHRFSRPDCPELTPSAADPWRTGQTRFHSPCNWSCGPRPPCSLCWDSLCCPPSWRTRHLNAWHSMTGYPVAICWISGHHWISGQKISSYDWIYWLNDEH